MSFLKKLGEVLNAGSSLIPIFGPIISALIPKAAPGVQNVSDELTEIAKEVIRAEVIGQAMKLPGVQRPALITPMVAQILLRWPFLLGKKVKNHELFLKGTAGMAANMADILNSFEESSVEIIDVTVPQS